MTRFLIISPHFQSQNLGTPMNNLRDKSPSPHSCLHFTH
jgi:hypothetical protein